MMRYTDAIRWQRALQAAGGGYVYETARSQRCTIWPGYAWAIYVYDDDADRIACLECALDVHTWLIATRTAYA